jgi:signal transduction histidine kinase
MPVRYEHLSLDSAVFVKFRSYVSSVTIQCASDSLGAPVRLAHFILSEIEPILQEWEAFARTLKPAAIGMDSSELRDHASLMLKFIAEDLGTSQSAEQQFEKSHGRGMRNALDSAEDHGIGRLESKFTVEQLFSEYRALRASVLRLWRKTHSAPSTTDVDDIIRFNEAIDQLVAGSVFSFAEAQRKAEENEKQRRNQFLAMLAHELRNPLSPISTASLLLKKAEGKAAIVKTASEVISRQVDHLANLVNDLLDVSRVTRGLITVKLEPVAIQEIISDAVEQVMPQIQAHHHHLDVTGLPDSIVVRADKKRLVQVVTNLLANAAKYTPQGGQLQLKTDLRNDQVVVSVEDNGVGMTPEFIPRAFEMFSQVEQTSDRTAGGLGLGLALVKNLVELHSGTVVCSSDGIGKGSRFTVYLPRHKEGDRSEECVGAIVP